MLDSARSLAELHGELDRLLLEVEKPTRYIGGEWNASDKDPAEAEVSMLLAFPDLYELGMSHLGFRILYALLNEQEGVVAERAFMPWTDMLGLLRERGLPLVSLESRRPLGEFDLVGFSMQAELTITNVLAMLELGGVALESSERGEGDPLVLMGGPVVFNPEPFADFADAILLGDAEEALPELLELVRAQRREGLSRRERLRAIARLPGWYVPSLYELEAEPALGMLVPHPREGEEVPARVEKRIVYDLERHPFPAKIVVPHAEVVHDRVSWEIMRGCPVGCRFCQAGYVYRPTRERSPGSIAKGVRESLAATGYDEFSLTSLNSGMYGAIEPLTIGLMDEMEPRRIALGLSSLHASTMTETLAEQVKRVRKTGFTMAPEAGSERLRRVINKNLSEEQILEATRLAFEAGWQLIKLYFMVGLPTETMDDIDEMAALAEKILEQGRAIGGRRVKVTLSASTFIPKPHTPFQWFGMLSEEEVRARQQRLRERLPRGVSFKHHARSESFVEGVLSRADRSLGRAIRRAYEQGAVLDGWQEHLDLERWREAFEHAGVDAEALATRDIPLDAALPWEVVDAGLRRRWLRHEHGRALAERSVIPCGPESCAGCAPFARECVRGVVAERHNEVLAATRAAPAPALGGAPAAELARCAAPEAALAEALASGAAESESAAAPAKEAAEAPAEPPPPRPLYRYRAAFEKRGRARFIGHLDLVRTLTQSFRRAGLLVAYTEGFKPKPKISLSPALGLGISSRDEYIDFETEAPIERESFLPRLNACLVEGLRFTRLVEVDIRASALQEAIVLARYRAILPGVDPARARDAVGRFLAAEHVEIVRVRKGKERRIDLRALVPEARVDEAGGLVFALRMSAAGSARPSEVLAALVGAEDAGRAELERVGLEAEHRGRPLSPLLAGRLARTRGG